MGKNIEIKCEDGVTSIKIDGVDIPNVSELTFKAKADEIPTLELKLYCCDMFNK